MDLPTHRFKHLVALDRTGLEPWAREVVEACCDRAVFYDTDPVDEAETVTRAAGADALLVSWRTPVRRAVLDACPDLRYVGMCCTLLDEAAANVDVAHARSRGIGVKGVRDYGDEGLVEFILAELIRLFHGFGPHVWSDTQEELTGKTLGILGFGVTGQMLASRAQAFGMQVLYHSRTRRPELEGPGGVQWADRDDLLRVADVVSTHVPRHTVVIDAAGFRRMTGPKVLVNTSLEPTFDLSAFHDWIAEPGHFLIADRPGLGGSYDTLGALPRVITTPKVTGFTRQAEGRLSRKVVANLRESLGLAP